MGKLGDAVLLDEQTIKLASQVLGPNHLDTLSAKTRLAFGYIEQRRRPEAEPLLEQVSVAGERLPGFDRVQDFLNELKSTE